MTVLNARSRTLTWDATTAIEALAAAEEFLGGLHVPAALRRLVSEGRAGVARALQAREFDAR